MNPVQTTKALIICGSMLMVNVVACRSTNSGTESKEDLTGIAGMSEQQFVAACEQRLSDANEGAIAKQMLQTYVQTTNCAEAYPRIQKLIAGKASAPAP